MSDISVLRKKAKQLALSGNWGDGAIAINTRMIELDDRDADAYTRLAKCFVEQEKNFAAYEMYTQVLEFDPKNTIAVNNLKRLHISIAQIKKQKYLEELASLNSYEEAFNIGITANHKGNFEYAVIALKRAVELRPSSMYSLNALGSAYRHIENLDDARQTYLSALSISINPVSLVGLAAVERDCRRFEEAIRIYEQVLKENPMNAYALNGLGGVYYDLGELNRSEAYFLKASKISQGMREAMKGLEKLLAAYKKQGDQQSAERIFHWLATLSS